MERPPAWTALQARLLTKAGVSEDQRFVEGGGHSEEFDELVEVMRFIAHAKVDSYGDFRQTDLRSRERELWGAYWDIQRKFGRLETQTKIGALDEDIWETLLDMAVYCLRMIQIIRRLNEKGLLPHA